MTEGAITPPSGGSPSAPAPRFRLRLHHVYYLLAGFDLLTVTLGLVIINRVIEIYTGSAAVNQVWARRLDEYARLSGMAAAVNAPGNDVFDSRDVEAESGRLDEAQRRFDALETALRRDLDHGIPVLERASLLEAFEAIPPAMGKMVAEAQRIFAHFREGRPEKAGERMAAMDQEYATLNTTFAALERHVRDIQKDHFDEQMAAAVSLRRMEFVIAGLMVMMVAGVTFYGHTLSRRMRQAQVQRERADAELKRYRDHLEELVAQRTTQLEATHEQLRVAERLASIGTLAAGLGHDMNNVLFPIRCRLEVLEKAGLDAPARAELTGVRRSIEFLQQLADGLRLLALDPDDPRMARGLTHLQAWAPELRPLFQTALPRGAKLVLDVPAGTAPVAVAAHRLTQAAFNLVVNAGEALGPRGTVRVWARGGGDGTVQVGVTDDGHGMTPEVRSRALDPFFTTKKRGFSTGLGLALVAGVAKAAGGRVDIESAPEQGTTVVLTLPAATDGQRPAGPESVDGAPRAAVSIADPRMAAVLSALLRSEGFSVRSAPGIPGDEATLWLIDAAGGSPDQARRFLEHSPQRRLILYGALAPEWEDLAAACIDESDGLEAIRLAFRRAVPREVTA